MDKDTARKLGAAVEAALQPVAAQFGMTVRCGGGTFDPGGLFKPRIEFKAADGSFERAEFGRTVGNVPGFSVADYERTFTLRGIRYTLTGFKPYTRLSVLAKRWDGKTYKLEADAVRAALGIVVERGRLVEDTDAAR